MRVLLVLLLALPAPAQVIRSAVPVRPAAGLGAAAASVFRGPSGSGPSAPLCAQLLSKVISESPTARASLLASFEAAPFRTALGAVAQPEAWLAERLGEAFTPYFETYARETGHADAEAGLRHLLSEAPDAAETRRGLARVLEGGSARSESWTYLYRDAKLWQRSLEGYLDGRVAAKRDSGDRTLRLRSVGAAYGAEPYTLAMLAEDALNRAGEDPRAWDVRVDAADLSLMSLISAREGYYRDPRGNGRYFIPASADAALSRESAAGRLLPAGPPGLYRLREDLRGWVRPVYADLNDLRQQRAVTEGDSDVVFANYVLTHLLPGPAARLAEHWLSGRWSDHGFLGMAQTLVAEVSRSGALAAKGALGQDGSFLRRVALSVGAIGGAYAGQSNEPWQRARDYFLSSRLPAAKRVRADTARYREAIRRDPFHAEALDPKALLVLEHMAAKHGVRTELTTDDSLTVGMTRDGAVAVGAGLLMEGADAASRIAILERLFPVYAAKADKESRGPPSAFSDPRYGEGELVFSGTAVEGARLKAARFGAEARLLWLVPGRLAPITDRYVDETPPAPPRPKGAPGGGISVRF